MITITIINATSQAEAQRVACAAWDFHERVDAPLTVCAHDDAANSRWRFVLTAEGVTATRLGDIDEVSDAVVDGAFDMLAGDQ